ncbi:carbapenem-hydrolyzing class A beta-lactamase [Pseudomonas zeae]|uniref:carbapenem-hydrolyzing class A beta-lactamase n=1 Tax=Pseudomonas zeae TaxID=2745510 RepID=UPI0039E0F51E
MAHSSTLAWSFSLLLSFLPFSSVAETWPQVDTVLQKILELEKDFGGRIGVSAIDTGSNRTFEYRADERFPLCSSFKGFLAGAVLSRSEQQEGLLQKRIHYENRVMEPHSPISEKHMSVGMTVAELAAAAVQYSDNGATNLLLENVLEGPGGMTAFMRDLGDTSFRLDRWELELNSAIPGDVRDTSTPYAIANSLQKIAVGDSLQPATRQQLVDWLIGNTTGGARIRAGVPADWIVGDKTGTCGLYGTANDYAVIWPKTSAAIVLAIYTAKPNKDDKHSDTVIAAATRAVLEGFDNH